MNDYSNSGDIARRSFFERTADGIYGMALGSLLGGDLFGSSPLMAAKPIARRTDDVKPREPHFEPKAKAVIHLFMHGGPSQVDLFDPKPDLTKFHGKSVLDRIINDVGGKTGAAMRSPFKFAQHGRSGTWLSEVMPHLSEVVDDIAVIRSMFTTHRAHEPAIFKINSGRILPALPTLGSWVVYGLGSENQNLPAYIALDDPLGLPDGGVQNWQNGFLSPVYQGTRFRSVGSPVLNLQPETAAQPEIVRLRRELLGRLNQLHKRDRPGESRLDARIASYELAARMQMKTTDALDLSQETQGTFDMYGVNQKATDSYARRCIMARRLVERGVRFVQLFLNGSSWDHHSKIEKGLRSTCRRTDKPVAALLKDLKQRGLLNDTLILWGGEFGRLPVSQSPTSIDPLSAGRDHGPSGFSVWMAGGGIKGGTVYGATDDIGYAAVENRVSVADWHATILHLLGIDHEKLSVARSGLNESLTVNAHANPVKEIMT